MLIVDDHAVVREGLRTFLELQDGIEVVGEAADGEEAVSAAARLRARRDPDGPRDAAPRRRSARCARCASASRSRVIVLTSFLDDERLMPALRGGRGRLPAQGRRARRAGARGPQRPRRRGADRPDGRRAGCCARSLEPRPPAATDGERLTRARARGPGADRGRALEQADRARARGRREDGQDPRRPRAGQARRRRPHPGGAAGGPAAGRRVAHGGGGAATATPRRGGPRS